jgi:hypothetical protein
MFILLNPQRKKNLIMSQIQSNDPQSALEVDVTMDDGNVYVCGGIYNSVGIYSLYIDL